jgi:hypothetical protein
LPVEAECESKSSAFLPVERTCHDEKTFLKGLVILIDTSSAFANYYYKNPWGAAIQGAAVLSSLFSLEDYVDDKKLNYYARYAHSSLKATAMGIALTQKEKDFSFQSTFRSTISWPMEWILKDGCVLDVTSLYATLAFPVYSFIDLEGTCRSDSEETYLDALSQNDIDRIQIILRKCGGSPIRLFRGTRF